MRSLARFSSDRRTLKKRYLAGNGRREFAARAMIASKLHSETFSYSIVLSFSALQKRSQQQKESALAKRIRVERPHSKPGPVEPGAETLPHPPARRHYQRDREEVPCLALLGAAGVPRSAHRR